jgi:diacylglycerol O-acyltransferase
MVTRVIAKKVAAKARQRVAATVAPVAPAARTATRKARKAAKVVQKNVTDAVVGTLGLHGERMSKVDTAWLRMDSASNLMMIVGVWVIQPGIRYEDLAQRLEERLLKYPRFVQCAVEDAAGATWVNDPDFDMTHHLVTETLPKKPAGREQEALQDRLAALSMEPLDPNRPLWQIHLVQNYKGAAR